MGSRDAVVFPGTFHVAQPLWDESEHPRWPADTPGSRGGQFRSKTGGPGLVSSGTERWIQTALTGVGIDLDEDELLHVVKNGRQVGRSPLYGGNVGVTAIVTFEMPDGQRIAVVHKHQDYELSAHEVWASRIGRAIGAPVPTVIHDPDDEDSIYLPYIEGHAAVQRAHAISADTGGFVYEIQEDLTEEHSQTRRGALLGLLDVALMNADRHGGNWMIDHENQAWGIDHTHIRPWDIGDYTEDVGYEDFGTMVVARLTPLSATDIAQARAQIGELVDRNRIPQEWHLPMEERLERLQRTYEQSPHGPYSRAA